MTHQWMEIKLKELEKRVEALEIIDKHRQESEEEEQTPAWMHTIFNKDKIMEMTEQWTKEAEEAGMTLTEYLEAISPLNDKEKPSWIGKNCKDCGNEKCKKLGTLPKGYDCALWQAESEGQMTAEREKAINEWLRVHCQKCVNNDDRGTGFLNCQAECEVIKDIGIACIHYEEAHNIDPQERSNKE